MKVYIILTQHIDGGDTTVYAVYKDYQKANDDWDNMSTNDSRHSYWIEDCEVKE